MARLQTGIGPEFNVGTALKLEVRVLKFGPGPAHEPRRLGVPAFLRRWPFQRSLRDRQLARRPERGYNAVGRRVETEEEREAMRLLTGRKVQPQKVRRC